MKFSSQRLFIFIAHYFAHFPREIKSYLTDFKRNTCTFEVILALENAFLMNKHPFNYDQFELFAGFHIFQL